MANPEQKSPIENLNEIVGTDISKLIKQGNPTSEMFKKVVETRLKAKEEAAFKKAEEQFGKVLELVEQKDKLDREYKKAYQKVEEELKKAVEQIQRSTNPGGGGQQQPEQPEAPVVPPTTP